MIAYQKGGSILQMTINVIGENRWRHGMNKYLNGQKFTNTDGDIYFSYMNKAVTDVSDYTKSEEIGNFYQKEAQIISVISQLQLRIIFITYLNIY